jgi:hypothetical protein
MSAVVNIPDKMEKSMKQDQEDQYWQQNLLHLYDIIITTEGILYKINIDIGIRTNKIAKLQIA